MHLSHLLLNILIAKALILLLISCQNPKTELITITYSPDTEDFLNPERGFYRPFGTKTSAFRPLDAAKLRELRKPQKAAGGFQAASTLTYRSYQLDLFKDRLLTTDILLKIESDLQIIREVGNKAIFRFSYSDHCCDPPFNDAPKKVILQHLEQLKPVFHENKDVIAVVQMGLIGPWGEQFYSDHFGDLEHGPLTDQHWLDRNEVIQALLDVVPQERMIQLRAPYYKLRYLDGNKANPATAEALTIENAFNRSPIARLAHHNDCIMANYDDYWTYHSFHQWPPVSDTSHLKPYIAAETKFLVFGGETCPGGENGEDVYDPYNNCLSDGGFAEHYLKRFHTSFLNTSWAPQINGDWNNKCIEDIKKSLGYRLALLKGVYPASIKRGINSEINLEIMNQGYASPYNPRLVELVLRNTEDQTVHRIKVDSDPRYWFPDKVHKINVEVKLPDTLAKGQYELFLNLPDPEPLLYNRPEYAIRLASKYELQTGWESSTGWNRLFCKVQVK